MESVTLNISSLNSPQFQSYLTGLDYKQFQRTYFNNFKVNFTLALSSCKDFQVKNFTNFFLTDKFKVTEIFEIENPSYKTDKILTKINIDGKYLSAGYIGNIYNTINYGTPILTNNNSSNFYLEFLDEKCHIYQEENYKNYYLCNDTENNLYFIREKFLSFDDSTINPQDFNYLISDNKIILFKDTLSGAMILTNEYGDLVLRPITNNSIFSNISNDVDIDRDIYYDSKPSLNFSFITYNNTNFIDNDKSIFNLNNNFLLHKKYCIEDETNVIVLKNQLLNHDVFSSANNLLSSSSENYLYVDDMREYTSISNDILDETSSNLELNYVFNNITYPIKPGSNIVISPSSMYPFSKLNVNDTKFVNSGAFSYITPEFSDKIYHISKEPQNRENGQYLLCTWLSGHPFSNKKIWVDRYYYPDLVDKKTALQLKSYTNPTYENYVESLIQNNSEFEESVSRQRIFDKISDFTFEANETYTYDRFSPTALSGSINYCNGYNPLYPVNYYNTLNDSGEFTFGVFFDGDSSNWTILSERGEIDAGLTFVKVGNQITMTYKLYDPSTNTFYNYSKTSSIKQKTVNFILFSIDTILGECYFYLNDEVVLEFNISQYQFNSKQLLYGDFFVLIGSTRTNLLAYNGPIYDPFIDNKFLPSSLAFSIPLSFGKVVMDTIYITLPSGLRNGIDNIEYLQTICNNNTFKSNNINIHIKNLNIDNDNIKSGIVQNVTNLLKPYLPANTVIKNTYFEDYK